MKSTSTRAGLGNPVAPGRLTPTPQPHRGAVQRDASQRRTALPGVGCRPLLNEALRAVSYPP